jgi:hypothetical protein
MPPNFPSFDQFQQQQGQQQQGRRNVGDNPWYKTKKSKYWQEGKCKKVDECSYLHD